MTEKRPAYQLVATADCVLKDTRELSLVDREKYEQDFSEYAVKLAEYVKENVRSDDDELVTIEHMESLGFGDVMGMANVKRYDICNGIRVVFFAEVGGWSKARLWSGGGTAYQVADLTKGELRQLMKALRIGG